MSIPHVGAFLGRRPSYHGVTCLWAKAQLGWKQTPWAPVHITLVPCSPVSCVRFPFPHPCSFPSNVPYTYNMIDLKRVCMQRAVHPEHIVPTLLE